MPTHLLPSTMAPLRNLPSAGAAIAFLLAIRLDAPLVRLVQAHSTPALDQAFDALSQLASAELALAAGLGLYLLGHLSLARRRVPPASAELRVRSGVLLLLTLLSGATLTWLLKNLAARARPQLLIDHGFSGFGLPFSGHPFNSFPSSHAFTAFAAAAVLAKVQPAWQWPALALALAAAACRVLTLEHYPSDVLFSALIACGCAQFWAARALDPQAAWPLRSPWHRRSSRA